MVGDEEGAVRGEGERSVVADERAAAVGDPEDGSVRDVVVPYADVAAGGE